MGSVVDFSISGWLEIGTSTSSSNERHLPSYVHEFQVVEYEYPDVRWEESAGRERRNTHTEGIDVLSFHIIFN